MTKFIDVDEAVALVKDGMTIMVGGFLGCGTAQKIIDGIVEKGVKDLTLIVNDGQKPDLGSGKLIVNKQVRKLIASHIGTNPAAVEQFNSGEMLVEFVPQGTFCERIRAAGSGLGGVLTPTGLGTMVAEGKEHITVDGQEYLLEKPLKADLAILGAHTVDKRGNLWFKGTSRNFNDMMALAADVCVVEADNVVEVGTIEPENIMVPGVVVDYVVDGSKK